MYQKIKLLMQQYREQILYLIFGVLTTAIDWAISFLLYHVWGEQIEKTVYLVHLANVIAWSAAVLFAFVTNRVWVFESQRKGLLPILSELTLFAGGRVTTLLLQEGIFFLFCDTLRWSEYFVKLASAVLVVILNYVISKLLIFRKK